MKRSTLFVFLFMAAYLNASDLTLTVGGKVSIELRFAGAKLSNSMSIVSPPNAGIAFVDTPDPDDITRTKPVELNGCQIEAGAKAVLPGITLLSDKLSQRGCRVQLDFNRFTEQIDPFPAGTVLRFAMCAVVDSVPPVCDYVWSSDRLTNNGTPPFSLDLALDHLMVVPVTPTAAYAGRIFDLRWEDLPSASSDRDFNDLFVRLTVELDSDGDGLWDDWEEFGIDTDGDGTRDYILGTDKYRKDLFLVLDYMDCNVGIAPGDPACPSTHNHALNATARTKLEQAFLNAPVTNVMGRPPGIFLHIQNGAAVRHSVKANIPGRCSRPPFNDYPPEGNFDTIKASTFPVIDRRRFTHRYGLLAHNLSASGVSGCAELPGNDFIVTLGDQLPTTPARIVQQAGTIMHELGHTFGLQHGGDEPVHGKPNYLSVMSYTFQRAGIPQFGGTEGRLDYSRGNAMRLDEMNLSEPAGIGLLPTSLDMTGFFCVTPNLKTKKFTSRRAGGGIDWNCSGVEPVGDVAGNAFGDINGDRFCLERGGSVLASSILGDDESVGLGQWVWDGPDRQCDSVLAAPDSALRPFQHDQLRFLNDFNDWQNLQYAFQLSPDFDSGVHVTGPPDAELDERNFNLFLAPDPSITITPLVAGASVTYTIRLTNSSTAAAENIIITDVLPAQLAFVSCVSTSGGVCGGSGNNRTISFSALGGGNTATITLTAKLTCPATPTTILNTASLTSTSTDRVGGNNIASASITATPACTAASLPVSINQSVVTFNRATGRYAQTVTLTNLGAALPAVAYVADGLPAGVAMFTPSGVTSAALPAGSPYKELGPIAPGATLTFTLEFTRTGTPAIVYLPRLLGPGPR